MQICFVMGRSGHYPCGGYKIVYEYANRLVQRGHQVTVVHPTTSYEYSSFTHRLKIYYHYLRRLAGLDGGYRPDAWFKMDPRVNLTWVPNLREPWIPKAEIVVATAWQTAEWVARYSAQRGRKYYFIQGWETVFNPADPQRVVNTYRLPLRKIVIARWLEDKLAELGESAVYIPNGLDFEEFGLDVPPEKRNPYQLMMLYHQFDCKGVPDALAAVRQVKDRIPEIRLTMFGVYDRPDDLPAWVEYYKQPEQGLLRRLYNQAAIFIIASWVEGWGLTPC
jgi:glycosyltransferase involved in cell wall biosynthesis